jgi:hypothetical protein
LLLCMSERLWKGRAAERRRTSAAKAAKQSMDLGPQRTWARLKRVKHDRFFREP